MTGALRHSASKAPPAGAGTSMFAGPRHHHTQPPTATAETSTAPHSIENRPRAGTAECIGWRGFNAAPEPEWPSRGHVALTSPHAKPPSGYLHGPRRTTVSRARRRSRTLLG